MPGVAVVPALVPEVGHRSHVGLGGRADRGHAPDPRIVRMSSDDGYSSGSGRPTGWPTSARPPTTTAARSARSRVTPTRSRLVVARGEATYAVLNLHPYNPGHLMVLPYRHVADLEDLTDGGVGRADGDDPAGDPHHPRGQQPARLQRRAQPRRARPAARWPTTCTSTSYPAGPATPTSSPSSAATKTLPAAARRHPRPARGGVADRRDQPTGWGCSAAGPGTPGSRGSGSRRRGSRSPG